jgi:hypothetical protein
VHDVYTSQYTNPPYCTNCICFKRIQIYRYISVTISVYIYERTCRYIFGSFSSEHQAPQIPVPLFVLLCKRPLKGLCPLRNDEALIWSFAILPSSIPTGVVQSKHAKNNYSQVRLNIRCVKNCVWYKQTIIDLTL